MRRGSQCSTDTQCTTLCQLDYFIASRNWPIDRIVNYFFVVQGFSFVFEVGILIEWVFSAADNWGKQHLATAKRRERTTPDSALGATFGKV